MVASIDSPKQLAGFALMCIGNQAAIFSCTCSSYFSTDKFTESEEDRKRAMTAGLMGLILCLGFAIGVFLLFKAPKAATIAAVFGFFLFYLYYDVITDKKIWKSVWSMSEKVLGESK